MQLLTTKEAAAYLKLHECTVKKYYRSGQLKGFKLGNGLRFSTVDVEAFIQQQYPKEDKVCCTKGTTQSFGGLRSLTMERSYKEALGLTTKS